MKLILSPVIAAACVSGGLAACQSPRSSPTGDALGGTQQAVGLDNCIGGEDPAHVVPVYTRPADDRVALGSLLEGAGYAIPSNSDWTDVAAGHLCRTGQQLVMLKAAHSYFSVMSGPTPYPVGTGDLNSDPAHPWRAVTAGRLDTGDYDSVVAVRKVTATGVPDLVVAKADPTSCNLLNIVATATIGNPNNSEWVDAAIGNFDGTGNQIALLKASGDNLFLERLNPDGSLVTTYESDLPTSASTPWKAIGAGDLDGDGKDELVVARQVSDNTSPTVLVYRWVGGGFQVIASTTFGNNGNSAWASMAVGDFNGDGKKSIALLKNASSYFAVFDLLPGVATLRELATLDLDSVSGQSWRGLTATDWLGGDQGAAELVAVRSAQSPYVADILVYGNPFHRIARDSGINGARATWTQQRADSVAKLVADLKGTHINTMNWDLSQPDDYLHLVEFLDATRNVCIDGQRLRVWITTYAAQDATTVSLANCASPQDSPITSWNELSLFANQGADDAAKKARCIDYLGWASLLGRLAQDYPQLVAMNIDDYGNHPEWIPVETIAEMQSRMRSQAPWLDFVPTVYFGNPFHWAPDLTRTFDSFIFYFRNESHSNPPCLYSPCGEDGVNNVTGEIAVMSGLLPAGRKLQLGMYFGSLFSAAPKGQSPRFVYDDQLVQLGMSNPLVGGLTAYPMQSDPGHACNSTNYLAGDPPRGPSQCGNGVCEPFEGAQENCQNWPSLTDCPPQCPHDCPGRCGNGVCDFLYEDSYNCPADCSRYCVLQRDFGQTGRCTPGQVQSCGNCGTQTCTTSFTWGACTGQGVCTPGQTSGPTPCGDCGTRVDTCSNSCQWVAGNCGGQGECSPGDEESCCPCSPLQGCRREGTQICSGSCSWGGCDGFSCGKGQQQ